MKRRSIDLSEMAISIIALTISLVSIVIAYYSFQREHRTSIVPVLIFSMRSKIAWQVQNVGKGPALDVIIGDGDWNGNWSIIAQCYPIAAGATVALPWVEHGAELAATYTDIYGHSYTSWCKHDRTQVSEKNLFPKWKPNRREWELIHA